MGRPEPLEARHRRALADIVGDRHVLTDPELTAGHVTDWTGRWKGRTAAVIRPAATGETAAVVAYAAAHRLAVVPQGGNTGMVGGSVPLAGELVLSMRRMAEITDTDPVSGQVTAGAGATVAAVQQAAAATGMAYGIDLGARDSATIGGTIATNAGGVQVLRHGDTRRQLLGIEAVTGTGEIIGDLRGLLKDNTGYHLPSLLCGSEGTLAVITRARLRLVAAPDDTAVAIVGCRSEAEAFDLLPQLRTKLPDLNALEFFTRAGLALVRQAFALPAPMSTEAPAYLLVEVAGVAGAADRLSRALAQLGAIVDAVVADDAVRREGLWRYREAHTEAISSVGVPHKLDITVPVTHLARFCVEVRERVAAQRPNAQVWLFGHAGDGNIHVNVTGVDPDDDGIDEAVLALVAEHGGSISAEHGIGRAKARWLPLNRTADELAVYRRLRAAFDPAGILNPGVLAVTSEAGTLEEERR